MLLHSFTLLLKVVDGLQRLRVMLLPVGFGSFDLGCFDGLQLRLDKGVDLLLAHGVLGLSL